MAAGSGPVTKLSGRFGPDYEKRVPGGESAPVQYSKLYPLISAGWPISHATEVKIEYLN